MVEAKIKQKAVGTLVPIFSLVSSQQISQDQGSFETGLYFLDWLEKTGQTAWQILPLNETQLEKGSAVKHVPSPYKGYGVGLAPKYLSAKDAQRKPTLQEKNTFIAQNKEWIEDYALFCSIRDVYGTDDWRTWNKALRTREKGVLKEWVKSHKLTINYYIVTQWQLHQSYKELHAKAKASGIALIGDIPYYISVQSPLVWAHQKAFQMNKDGTLPYVSGIPNTPGTYFGRQIWGHPLYNWENQDEVIKVWKMRLQHQSELFDHVRFDHAKAFFTYGKMEADIEANDQYVRGPGENVFKEILSFIEEKGLKVFAEDSGDGTGGLRKCLKEQKIAGIKIFHFAMKPVDEKVNEKYVFVKRYEENCVAYTTSHDTETLLGYMQRLSPTQKKKLAIASEAAYDATDSIFAKNIREAVLSSPAQLVIIPIQDWLLSTDRINIPGTEKEVGDTNWQYRVGVPVEGLPEVK
ncbi:MAG: 4-alpha-glucanotransferase [Candidatus Levybacteria bacterium]|nr:4-alpha-glucanotransferase [Candidatus Levybacteria bacterium]